MFDTLAFAEKNIPAHEIAWTPSANATALTTATGELHGALLDAEILADVYLLMTGGQASLWMTA